MASRKLNIIVASCNNGGIGKDGKLPWRLRGDMTFFKKTTSTTHVHGKKNAVIMGRKTWDSIPEKNRPLENRVNVIITRSMQKAPEGAYIADSFDAAVDLLTSPPLSEQVESLFVIGGHAIYKMAFEHDDCHRVYHTRVLGDFDCDTYMPDLDKEMYKPVEVPHVDPSVKEEENVKYHFEVLEKVQQ